jgi:hypothetical protein
VPPGFAVVCGFAASAIGAAVCSPEPALLFCVVAHAPSIAQIRIREKFLQVGNTDGSIIVICLVI